MTPEKRAAAIAWLTDEIRSMRMAPTINGCDMKPEWAEQLEIMETCLEAVKGHGSEPLTLEQLREMDGKPVWMVLVDNPNSCEWMIVCAKEKCCEGKTYIVDFSNIGNLWLAYAYPPAHIDREAWEPCSRCKSCSSCAHFLSKDAYEFCKRCITGQEHKPLTKYCPECGRPLTPEAWAELEKRLRG